jgi:hypothetical protein
MPGADWMIRAELIPEVKKLRRGLFLIRTAAVTIHLTLSFPPAAAAGGIGSDFSGSGMAGDHSGLGDLSAIMG